jgi:hypothetical protein
MVLLRLCELGEASILQQHTNIELDRGRIHCVMRTIPQSAQHEYRPLRRLVGTFARILPPRRMSSPGDLRVTQVTNRLRLREGAIYHTHRNALWQRRAIAVALQHFGPFLEVASLRRTKEDRNGLGRTPDAGLDRSLADAAD